MVFQLRDWSENWQGRKETDLSHDWQDSKFAQLLWGVIGHKNETSTCFFVSQNPLQGALMQHTHLHRPTIMWIGYSLQPQKTKYTTTIGSSNPTPGHLSRQNFPLQKIHAALFVTAKPWKQPKCPSTEEWIKKMWSIDTMEYYSGVKKNERMTFAGMWVELEILILNEVSQTEKDT